MTRCGILLELMGQGEMIMGVGHGEDRDALMTLYWKIPLNFVFKRSSCGMENICSDKTKLPRYFFCQEGRNKDSPRDKGPGAAPNENIGDRRGGYYKGTLSLLQLMSFKLFLIFKQEITKFAKGMSEESLRNSTALSSFHHQFKNCLFVFRISNSISISYSP